MVGRLVNAESCVAAAGCEELGEEGVSVVDE